jgi:hypothetical protein
VITRLCRCRYPIWQLTADGRKPLRCTHCHRRAVKPRRLRKLTDRVLIAVASRRVMTRTAVRLLERNDRG